MKTSKEADMLCFSDLSSHNFNTLIKEDKNIMENLSLWLAVIISWILILASYLFPEVFTPLMVFLLLVVLVSSVAANWAVSKSTRRFKRKSA